MGRNAHILRLALGRNADQAPDWPSLRNQYRRLDRDDDQSPITYGRADLSTEHNIGDLFNEKGHPINPQARDLDWERCEAVNAVVSIALPPPEADVVSKTAKTLHSSADELDPITICSILQTADDVLLGWIESFRDRLSVHQYLNTTTSLWECIAMELQHFGAFETLSAGYLRRMADSLFFDDVLGEDLVQAEESILPNWLRQRENLTALVETVTSVSLWFLRGCLLVSAHLHALHIRSSASPWRQVAWISSLRFYTPRQLFDGVSKVLVPAMLLCTLRLQAAGMAQQLLYPDLCSVIDTRDLPYFGWVLGQRHPRKAGNDPRDSSPFRMRNSQKIWSTSQLSGVKSVANRAHSWLLESLGLESEIRELEPTNEREQNIQTLSYLPSIFTAQLIPELFQQILLSPLNAVICRSLAWLFIVPQSPFRVGGEHISANDLFPILPRLSDFQPGFGLRDMLGYMGKVALTFALQSGISFAFTGVKSAAAVMILRRKVEEESRTNHRLSMDVLEVD